MPDQEPGFVRYFAALPDPRVNRTKKHAPSDILGVTLCAVICGADSFEEIERYGDAREDWLRTFLKLPNGIPSHDTFNRVLAALDRDRFSACLARWMTDLCEATGLRVIAVLLVEQLLKPRLDAGRQLEPGQVARHLKFDQHRPGQEQPHRKGDQSSAPAGAGV